MNDSSQELELKRALQGLRPDDADAGAVAERATRRAAEKGLAEVAYTTTDSPVGELLIAITPRGLVRVAYTEFRPDAEVLDEMVGLGPIEPAWVVPGSIPIT